MKKRLLLVLCFFALVFSCKSDDDSSTDRKSNNNTEWIQNAFRSDLKKEDLKGNIKFVKSIVSGGNPLTTYGITTKHYNPQGYLLERIDYEANGTSIFTKESYIYNGVNLIEQKDQYQFNPDAYDKAIYKYGKGRFAESFIAYNEKDQIIGEGKVIVNNNESKIKIINPINNKIKNAIWYNANGDIIKQEAYSDEGDYIGKTIFVFDSKGSIIEETSYNSENNIQLETKRTFVYDEYNNVINETVFINDYINNNNISFYSNYVYTYDSKNNWVKKVTQVEGGVSSTTITTREIEYYQ